MGTAQDITALLKTQHDLLLAKESAEAATRAKSEFLANMSHEIRTPMTAILGYTDLLVDPNQTADQRAKHVEVVRRNGQHLLAVLNDILDISKIEAGKLALEMIEFDPAKVLAEVQSLMLPVAADKGLAFGIEQRGRLPERILSDPTRLKQILLNLVGNAIKFTSAGSVRIAVEAQAMGTLQRLRFDVVDTGIGLTDEQQSRLFTPFVQADTSLTRRFGGSGLGLAICKRLATMLGGDLSIASQFGVGSTFTLHLEVHTPAPSPPVVSRLDMARSAPAAVSMVPRKILVAEDTNDTRRLVALYLQHSGAIVEEATNGQLAVEAVVAAAQQGQSYDLVLMDMQMPIMDGFTATAKLRQLGYVRLPIIAFTAHAMAEERQRCLEAGCNDFVSKPIDVDELFRVVNRFSADNPPEATPPPQRQIRSLRHGDPAVETILAEYTASLSAQAAAITQSLAEQDLLSLRLKVHQLRGSGGSYGFPELSRLAEQAENLIAASQPFDKLDASINELLELLRCIQQSDADPEARASASH